MALLESIWQDFRFGARSLVRTPVVTLSIVTTLMLGIGANAVLFSIVYTVLFKPFAYRDPEQLLWIGESGNSKRAGYELVLTADIADWHAQSHSLAAIAAIGLGQETLTVNGQLDRLWAVEMSESPDRIFGISFVIGRGFLSEELALGGPKAVLLSDRLFRRRFAADPAILGQAITLGGQFYSVVGVLPPDFHLPLPASTSADPVEVEAILAAPLDPARRLASGAIARVKPHLSLQTLYAELAAILERSKKAHPSTASIQGSDRKLRIATLHERVVGRSRLMLIALWGAVTAVLLIASVNVTNLLLAKAAGRTRENAIRAALGAGRTRLIRQFFLESLMLSSIAAGAGLLLAVCGIRLVVQHGPSTIPRLQDAGVDWNVIVFTVVVSVITGMIFGIAPALTSSQARPQAALSRAASTTTSARGRRRIHDVLIVCEIALTLVLMAGAALMLKGLWLMNAISTKYLPEQVLSARVEPATSDSLPVAPAKEFMDESIRQIESMPNVRAAGFYVSQLSPAMELAGLPFRISLSELMDTRLVTPHFFQAAGLELLAGRAFSDRDDERAPRVAIVNENYVRRYGLESNVSIVGQQIRSVGAPGAPQRLISVIGVISDFRRTPDSDSQPQIYMPLAQTFLTGPKSLYVRTISEPLAIAGTIRKIITRDHSVAIGTMQTLEEEMSIQIAPRHFQTALLVTFAMVSLVLAVVGIYGVLSYAVTERTREIGIRMALGAERRNVLEMVIVGSARLVGVGIGLGLLGAWALTRMMSGLIYGVKPNESWAYVAVCSVLACLALLASYVPARRAMRVDAMRALRHE